MILLLVLNGFLLTKINNYSKAINDINILSKDIKKELLTLEQNIIDENLNENLKLREDIKFINIHGNVVLAQDIFKKHALVLRYSESNCSDCIKAELNAVLKNKELFVNDIYIIAHYRNKRDLYVFYRDIQNKGLKNIKMYLLPDKDLNIPADKLNMPYYFCIDSTLLITNFFIPQKDKPKLSENYLLNTSKNFLGNNATQ